MLQQTDYCILENYKEKTIKKNPDYSRMLKFKCKNINSYYYMDNNDKFWLLKSIFDNTAFSDAETEVILKNASIQKYLDIDNNSQELFFKMDNFDELFAILDKKIQEDQIFTQEQFTFQEFKSLLKIIILNKRWGAPRKSIIIDKKIFNIQFTEDREPTASILQPKLEN